MVEESRIKWEGSQQINTRTIDEVKSKYINGVIHGSREEVQINPHDGVWELKWEGFHIWLLGGFGCREDDGRS